MASNYESMFKKKAKLDLSLSLETEAIRAQAKLVKESLEQLNRALADLDNVGSEISMLIEAAKESYSQVQRSISTLHSASSFHDKNSKNSLQSGLWNFGQGQAVNPSALGLVPQTVGAGEQQSAQQPWPEGQG